MIRAQGAEHKVKVLRDPWNTVYIGKQEKKSPQARAPVHVHPNRENSASVFVSKMTKNADGEAKERRRGL